MKNKICVVTGGTRGIGRAIAKMMLKEEAQVAICGRDQRSVDDAVRELHAETGGKVVGKAADVRNHEDIAELFRYVDVELGGLEVLVNNAGVGVFQSISDFSVEDWQLTLETNLSGVFYCCREAFPRFRSRGGGYIVNISSLAGKN